MSRIHLSGTSTLNNVRLLIGKDRKNKSVHWDAVGVEYTFICNYSSLPSYRIYLITSYLITPSLNLFYLLLDHPLLIITPLWASQLNSGRVQRFCSEVGWVPLERLVNDFKVRNVLL